LKVMVKVRCGLGGGNGGIGILLMKEERWLLTVLEILEL